MMSYIRCIGDTHGKNNQYHKILKESPHPTVQVGDMGIGFKTIYEEFYPNPSYDLMVRTQARFIRGNHDNPAICKRHTQWIPDGLMEVTPDNTKIMYIGGAWSIDEADRTPDYTWWADEELSYQEFDKVVFNYNTFAPDVVITHDCPTSIAFTLFLEGTHKKVYKTRTGQAFEAMLSLHKPKVWCHGHWHQSRDVVINGTRFICLAELETMDLKV